MPVGNKERHRTGRIGWLRAAVLGANDGILSTASLVLGVATGFANQTANIRIASDAVLPARRSAHLDPLLPQQPDFDHLCEAHIAEQSQHQDRPVQPRQLHEAQRGGQWGIWQPHSEGHDG